ncbi:hypothetical protein N7471_000990 [Penicillium samsonianum]|uniref:uncharacterized protein n=1 Tax=Penicillium samsonianum TaxID=1882272 RepID=UPI002547905D|nr:uncharacterized protein N7471_000990 [Penicillium samsonianum]KAJ6149791.1 hypothetical protein N7471_000990 [Penicillium samsonianum]
MQSEVLIPVRPAQQVSPGKALTAIKPERLPPSSIQSKAQVTQKYMSSSLKLVIVETGPVGTLAALYAASRGWKVEIYELRADARLLKNSVAGERASISLALERCVM